MHKFSRFSPPLPQAVSSTPSLQGAKEARRAAQERSRVSGQFCERQAEDERGLLTCRRIRSRRPERFTAAPAWVLSWSGGARQLLPRPPPPHARTPSTPIRGSCMVAGAERGLSISVFPRFFKGNFFEGVLHIFPSLGEILPS